MNNQLTRQSWMVAAAAAVMTLPVLAQAQAVVRIGHVAPVSGAQAHFGRDNENGARLAIEELNAQGVVIGGKKVKFELVAEDDAADPKQGTAAAQKLCDAKVNGVIGHLNSGTTIPAAKIYNSCGLPMITPSATNPELTTLGYKSVYRMLANDNALGAGLAKYAKDTLKLKKVAIIDDRTAYGKGVAEVFARTAKQLGMEVVSQQYTNDKAVDFMSILTSIKSKKPDGIFFGGMDPQAGPMLRQMQQLALNKVYLFGGDGICTDKLMDLSSGAKTLANVVCAVGGASLDKLPNGKTWRARYDAKFPGQFQVYAPYTYDATMVLVDAMKRANSADPKVYGPKLAEANYQGVTAKVVFEPNGELKNPAMTLYVYKDGKKVPLN
jgi:branched-chain amino acid transport system substrate-binding protein